ncbi:MAG: M4 family metallopeptidase, partial [candidate division Zixibacteria bacterium]|nr:M4 family metallopeptidase [candidate division Zixibacteria bacterium]
ARRPGNEIPGRIPCGMDVKNKPHTCADLGGAVQFLPTREVAFAAPQPGRSSAAGSMGIVAHEWGHGVTRFTSGLVYAGESGALNESFSDMLGVAVGFYKGATNFWRIGEGVILRVADVSNPEMSNPPQPDTYRRGADWFTINGCTPPSNDYCGVHTNSGVPNKMFYLFANPGSNYHNGITVNGIGIHNAMKVMLRAQEARYWTENTNFLQARYGSEIAAFDLDPSGDWAERVRNAWDAVRVCLKGDANSDEFIDQADVIKQNFCIFNGIDCNLCSCDVDCNDLLYPSDFVLTLSMVYKGGSDNCPLP